MCSPLIETIALLFNKAPKKQFYECYAPCHKTSASYIALLGALNGESLVHNAILLSLAALLAVAIIVIGCFYVISPQRMTGSFGLKPPAPDADTSAWLRLKGIPDIVSGLVVLTLMVTTDSRTIGIALPVLVITSLGDMANVLGSGGSKSTAFSVHGVTCVVMVVVGLFLIYVI